MNTPEILPVPSSTPREGSVEAGSGLGAAAAEGRRRAPLAVQLFVVLGAVGLACRLVLLWRSIGSNDLVAWTGHAEIIREHGIRYAYENRDTFNHPPLIGAWLKLAARLSHMDRHSFSLFVKLPGMIGDFLSAWLIWRLYHKQSPLAGAKAFAAYSLSLPVIMVAAYHGNTDCAYAGITLLAACLLAAGRPFGAGAAMALALNVKVLPVLLLPAFLLYPRSRSDFARLVAGLSLAIVPYAPFLLTSWHSMYHNMIEYNSQQVEWGLLAFGHYGLSHAKLEPWIRSFEQFYFESGRYVMIGAIVVAAVLGRFRRSWTFFEVCATTWALFLVLTPGFGVQYTVCVVPLLFAADLRRGIVYSLLAGAFLFCVYSAYVAAGEPLSSEVRAPFTPIAVLFGVLAWSSLALFVMQRLRAPVRALLGFAFARPGL